MKVKKINFSKPKILILLAINWVTIIFLTCYFLGENNEASMAIMGTLFIGFTLQLGFLSDQLKNTKNK
jgi:hypothetical protein